MGVNNSLELPYVCAGQVWVFHVVTCMYSNTICGTCCLTIVPV